MGKIKNSVALLEGMFLNAVGEKFTKNKNASTKTVDPKRGNWDPNLPQPQQASHDVKRNDTYNEVSAYKVTTPVNRKLVDLRVGFNSEWRNASQDIPSEENWNSPVKNKFAGTRAASDMPDFENLDSALKQTLNMQHRGYTGGFVADTEKANTLAYQNFDRLYSVYPDLEMTDLRPYVFLVRPDLNLIDAKRSNPKQNQFKVSSKDGDSNGCQGDWYIREMVQNYPWIIRQLTYQSGSPHSLMTFPTGRTESLQIPDYGIKNYSVSQPFTNLLIPYAGNAWESITGGTFDITFREDRYLSMHKLFQLWLYYIDGEVRNLWQPKKSYVQHNKLDYPTSVYYFICAPDAEEILWACKYTGAFPVNVPNSDLSFNLRGGVDNKVSIPFVYFASEVSKPWIYVDFNRNSPEPDHTYIDPYAPYTLSAGNGQVGAPFIFYDEHQRKYFLKWRPPIYDTNRK